MHEGDSSDGALIPPGRSPDPPAPPAGTRPRGLLRAWLTYLVVAVLSAAAGVGATLIVQRVTAPRPAAGMPRHAATDRLKGAAAMNDEAVYDAVEPGVVDVVADLRYLQESAKGTGFVIDAAAGLILTNNHVIDGATSVTVTPVTSGRSYPARIV